MRWLFLLAVPYIYLYMFAITTFQVWAFTNRKKRQSQNWLKLLFDKNHAHLISVLFFFLLVTLGKKRLIPLKLLPLRPERLWVINCFIASFLALNNRIIACREDDHQLTNFVLRSSSWPASLGANCVRFSSAESPILIQ